MTLCLLSAPSGAGKTAFCAALVEQARCAGWEVAGILSPPFFEKGAKAAILAQDLRSGETRPLAIASPPPPELHWPLAEFYLPLGNWLFSPAALAWGDEVLRQALPCDLFIVDELGPLELMESQGWMSALAALHSRKYRLGLVVVRPELLERACRILAVDQTFSRRQQLTPQEDARQWWRTFGAAHKE